jgi:hypothetical protein
VPGFGLKVADEFIDISLPGPYGAQEDDLGRSLLRSIGNGDKIFVYIQTDENRVILSHGWPPCYG